MTGDPEIGSPAEVTNMKPVRLLLLAVVLALSAASATSSAYRTRTIAVQGADDNALFSAAIRAFAEEGLVFRTKDRESGVVASEWTQVSADDTSEEQASVRFQTLDAQGRLFIDCRIRSKNVILGGWGEWKDCGGTRPDSMISIVNRLEPAIREDAARHPSGRPASQPSADEDRQ